jgi:hypothetical protein
VRDGSDGASAGHVAGAALDDRPFELLVESEESTGEFRPDAPELLALTEHGGSHGALNPSVNAADVSAAGEPGPRTVTGLLGQ